MPYGHNSRTRRVAAACMLVGAAACTPGVRSGAPRPVVSCPLDGQRWDRMGAGRAGEVRVALVVDPATRSGWDVYGAPRLRESLAAWNATGLPFRLVPTERWMEADIRIVAMRHLPVDSAAQGPMARYRAGFTRLVHDERGAIARAQVAIAEQAGGHKPYTVPEQVGTLLHELGHALGLPHLEEPMALMAARPRVEAITPSDLRLVRRRYLPGCSAEAGAIATRQAAEPGR